MPKTVNLTWNNTSSGITEQIVERSVTDGAFVQIGTTPPNQNSFIDNVDEFVGETKLSYKVSSNYIHEGTAYSASSSVFDIVINQSTTFVEPMLVTPSAATVTIESLSNLEIDWGDGTVQTVKTGDGLYVPAGNTYTHTYTDTFADKVISIKQLTGSDPIQFFRSDAIKEVQQWYSGGYSSTTVATLDVSFLGFGANLTTVPDIAPPNTTNLGGLFFTASTFNQNINGWDVSGVVNLTYLFMMCSAFNQPLDQWNTSNVTNMSNMFRGATTFNQDISSWNISAVTDMSYMFQSAIAFNQPLNNWNTSNVTNMNGVFDGATNFNQPLNSWNTAKVTAMRFMFFATYSFNQPLNDWDVSNVTDMSYMFNGALVFTQDLTQWCVSNIASKPIGFDVNASLFTEDKHPVWGTCPRGENLV